MSKSYRQERLGEEIKRVVSELILTEVKDPGLSGLISITEVKVSADGSFATLFISILGNSVTEEADEEEKEQVLAAFKRAKGLFKSEIAKRVKVRRIPELVFKMDTSMEYGRKISKVLDRLAQEEKHEE